jgi:hypothetical protein
MHFIVPYSVVQFAVRIRNACICESQVCKMDVRSAGAVRARGMFPRLMAMVLMTA